MKIRLRDGLILHVHPSREYEQLLDVCVVRQLDRFRSARAWFTVPKYLQLGSAMSYIREETDLAIRRAVVRQLLVVLGRRSQPACTVAGGPAVRGIIMFGRSKEPEQKRRYIDCQGCGGHLSGLDLPYIYPNTSVQYCDGIEDIDRAQVIQGRARIGPKGCATVGPHLHATCDRCGWSCVVPSWGNRLDTVHCMEGACVVVSPEPRLAISCSCGCWKCGGR